ncbi:hypothetical protein T484DRAFT_1964997 [Baffinella frigidus]|nr:hypothetical protein T484DRAFT_1964997 [Cryptophyta sp. CCMP2293]
MGQQQYGQEVPGYGNLLVVPPPGMGDPPRSRTCGPTWLCGRLYQGKGSESAPPPVHTGLSQPIREWYRLVKPLSADGFPHGAGPTKH